MASYSAKLYPEPDKKDASKMKEFFTLKYKQRRFAQKDESSDDSDSEKKKKSKKEEKKKKKPKVVSSEEEEEVKPKVGKMAPPAPKLAGPPLAATKKVTPPVETK